MGSIYRVKQVWWRLLAAMQPVPDEVLASILTPDLITLFRRMSHGDQTHSYRVMQQLQAMGHTHPDLLTAALLHDSGKSRYQYTIFDRVFVVVVKKLAPVCYETCGSKPVKTFRRAIPIAVQHPQWSAEDMAEAGASPLACTLARRHDEPFSGEPTSEEDRLLMLLQMVDSEA